MPIVNHLALINWS